MPDANLPNDDSLPHEFVITIDGPAGAGKSTAARRLADRLGLRYLDTGAMYRCITVACLHEGINLQDPAAVVAVAVKCRIRFQDDRVLLDDRDVTTEIRSTWVTVESRHIASNPGVRAHLVEQQRLVAAGLRIVTEGRDQGTVVFPAAVCKFFLIAEPEERARRRWLDLQHRGESISLEEILNQQQNRDARDAARSVGPLRPADDAIVIDTSSRTMDEVVDEMHAAVCKALKTAT